MNKVLITYTRNFYHVHHAPQPRQVATERTALVNALAALAEAPLPAADSPADVVATTGKVAAGVASFLCTFYKEERECGGGGGGPGGCGRGGVGEEVARRWGRCAAVQTKEAAVVGRVAVRQLGPSA